MSKKIKPLITNLMQIGISQDDINNLTFDFENLTENIIINKIKEECEIKVLDTITSVNAQNEEEPIENSFELLKPFLFPFDLDIAVEKEYDNYIIIPFTMLINEKRRHICSMSYYENYTYYDQFSITINKAI
ncbi:MAG: hypothetical protein MJ252_21850, partial [archaeon]|nr:hypothetical protein [archaeon]